MTLMPGFRPQRKFALPSRIKTRAVSLLLLGFLSTGCAQSKFQPPAEWPVYGGDPAGTRYSPLDQINRGNVRQLQVAWTWHSRDKRDDPPSTMECNPIVVDGVMYVTTALIRACALEAATGKVIWTFNPFSEGEAHGVNRGVTYWSEGMDKRILFVSDSLLYALDAATGTPIKSFGNAGRVDLHRDLDREVAGQLVGATTPGVVYKNLLILGSYVNEGPGHSAPGHIRAYDVRTGRREWIFHTIPHPGEFGHETWGGDSWETAGGANNWGGMTLDPERGLVFLATGSPAFDFYGGDRVGQNLFGNTVLALDALTGKRVWHFQTLHHDLWDNDLPCAPNLVTIEREGIKIDAVAQVTKTGMVYVLDRQNGEPVFGVEEGSAPESDLEGEQPWPTQPFPLAPPPFARQDFTEDLLTDISPEAHDYALNIFRASRAGKIFMPPSKKGTLVFPGFHGGANWSGASVDPLTGILYVNSNELPWLLTMIDAPPGAGFPYDHTGYHRFLDQEGYPAIKPPWGRLNAIDLNRGTILWQVTLGEFPELTERGLPPTGTENFGGTIVTAGGLVFIGATKDEKFRAFDKESGKILWEYQLEAGGYATPSTYEVDGKQYVVIAAGGGGKLGTHSGDSFVAFSLP